MNRFCIATFFLVFCTAGTNALADEAKLPERIRESKTLHLTVNGTYAPMEYVDPATNELKGLDIDLARAIADRLGVKIVWSNTAFAQLIPALQTKRTDFIISGLSDRASRRETMDFVDYLKTGAQFLVRQNDPAKTPTDICGKRIGTTRSTSFPVEIDKWSKVTCEAAGKVAAVYVPAENSIDARQQLAQGRVDAVVQGSETLPYALQNESGKFRILGEPFTLGYQGIAFAKDDDELRDMVTEALAALIEDGTYAKILENYGLEQNAVEKPLMNAAPQ